jgi:hypothetical protein
VSSGKFLGKTTHAAITGPIKVPLATSSTPAIILSFAFSVDDKNKVTFLYLKFRQGMQHTRLTLQRIQDFCIAA